MNIIAGVCFSHFFIRFAGGLAFVCISGLSVIARFPQGESRTVLTLILISVSVGGGETGLTTLPAHARSFVSTREIILPWS